MYKQVRKTGGGHLAYKHDYLSQFGILGRTPNAARILFMCMVALTRPQNA